MAEVTVTPPAPLTFRVLAPTTRVPTLTSKVPPTVRSVLNCTSSVPKALLMVRSSKPLSPVASMVTGVVPEAIVMVVLVPSVKLSPALEKSMLSFTVMASAAAEATTVPVALRLPVLRLPPLRVREPATDESDVTVQVKPARSKVPLFTVRVLATDSASVEIATVPAPESMNRS